MNVLNILWGFDISPPENDIRDPSTPITIDDFVAVSFYRLWLLSTLSIFKGNLTGPQIIRVQHSTSQRHTCLFDSFGICWFPIYVFYVRARSIWRWKDFRQGLVRYKIDFYMLSPCNLWTSEKIMMSVCVVDRSEGPNQALESTRQSCETLQD